jgi:hypothetical protein
MRSRHRDEIKKINDFILLFPSSPSSVSSSFFPSLFPLIHHSIPFCYYPVFPFLHFLFIFSHSLPPHFFKFLSFISFSLVSSFYFLFFFFLLILLLRIFFLLLILIFLIYPPCFVYFLISFSFSSSFLLSFLSSFSLLHILSSLLLTDPTQLCVRGLNQYPLPSKTFESRCSYPSWHILKRLECKRIFWNLSPHRQMCWWHQWYGMSLSNTNIQQSIDRNVGPSVGRSFFSKFLSSKVKIKKFWEEIIAYFTLIRHGPHRKRRIQTFFYCCMCICCRDNVFTKSLPSRDRRIYTQTHRLMGGIYDARRRDGFRYHDTYTEFHKS